MSNYRDLSFWKRRLSANTQPLPQGDMKLLLSTLITDLEKVNAEIQSLRSKGNPRTGKKLETRSVPKSDTD